jgi:hypothetical protein
MTGTASANFLVAHMKRAARMAASSLAYSAGRMHRPADYCLDPIQANWIMV